MVARYALLFLRTTLEVHCFLQLTLYGCREGAFIRGPDVGAMLISNVTEDAFQLIRNQASEILILPDSRYFQRPQVQIIFLTAILYQCHLSNRFQQIAS